MNVAKRHVCCLYTREESLLLSFAKVISTITCCIVDSVILYGSANRLVHEIPLHLLFQLFAWAQIQKDDSFQSLQLNRFHLARCR